MAQSQQPVRPLSEADRQFLLDLARASIRANLRSTPVPIPTDVSDALRQYRATFVTLRERATRELRGCRGEYRASRPLVESVVRSAVASATDDPRFPVVTVDELDSLHIEISVLTPLARITPDAVQVGRHGLLLRRGSAAGLLLPQVPVEQGWSRDEYLEWLCRKAHLSDGAWQDPTAELYAFQTDAWEEDPARP